MVRMFIDNKGITPVVATVILCGVVLTIGISAWSLTYSITSGQQADYYEGVKENINRICERFTVEHIAYDGLNLHVWIYNYGDASKYGGISIDVDVYVWKDGECLPSVAVAVPSGKSVEITVSVGELGVGTELVIEVFSWRENIVYKTYVVPAT